MDIKDLTLVLNQLASDYHIGQLQVRRAEHRGRATRSNLIFSKATIFDADQYAFHDGGRQELQFNVGRESRGDSYWWRHGVAFSFEPSRFLPDPSVLLPKVRRFNEWVESNADRLDGFQMWSWAGSRLCADRPPAEVSAQAIAQEEFVFLGTRVLERDVSPSGILADFDRLLPLYNYVESGKDIADAVDESPAQMARPRLASTTMTRTAAEVAIRLRHNVLQDALVEVLRREYPEAQVRREFRVTGGGQVDVAVHTKEAAVFCEIKVASSLRAALRQAVGQLLEYAHWPAENRAGKWWIVTDFTASINDERYLNDLRRRYHMPIYHRQLDPDAGRLGPEA